MFNQKRFRIRQGSQRACTVAPALAAPALCSRSVRAAFALLSRPPIAYYVRLPDATTCSK